MPQQDVTLQSGVNSQLTQLQNQAGVSGANLIRYKLGLPQKLGGWNYFYPFQLSTTPIRDLHAFQTITGSQFLGVASPTVVGVIPNSSKGSSANTNFLNLTPQGFQSNVAVSVSITSGSNVVTITDTGSSMSIYGFVRFDTPIAIGNLLINGGYPVNSVVGVNAYTILSSINASTTISSGGTLPKFYATQGSNNFGVLLSNNNFQSIVGLFYPFTAGTSVAGVTIQGPYEISSIADSTNFFINSSTPASTTISTTAAVSMNSTLMSIFHWTVVGPTGGTGLYGAGNYSTGLYGIGSNQPAGLSTQIVATDYLLDNWGQNLLVFQQNGPIFVWDPQQNNYTVAPLVAGGAPLYNLGGFVSQPQQIIMVYGSTQTLSGTQDPLLIRWCDSGAQSGYAQWLPGTATFAGSFRIPTGATLRAGLQGPVDSYFWTDEELWNAQFVNQPLVYSFSRLGSGCGALGPHAVGVYNGAIYWASTNNIYTYGGQGPQVMPCTVWDFMYQQLDRANASKVKLAVNSAFGEITIYFPIIGGTGENQAYIKAHIEGNEFEWDSGFLTRSAWEDISIVGMPVGGDQNGFVYQHEMGNDAAGGVLNSYLETGYFELGDGTGLVMVDWVLPDMKWTTSGGTSSGTILFTFYTVDYPGQPERVYGPYAVTQAIPYINTRMRGRYWRMRAENQDLGSFWRFGRVKFRWGYAGSR